MNIVENGARKHRTTPELKQAIADHKQTVKALKVERRTAPPLRKHEIDTLIKETQKQLDHLNPKQALW